MEKVVNQDKLLNAGGTKKKATALYAGHSVSQSGRHPGKQPRHKKQKGKQKKHCATKDCKNIVKVSHHKFCEACFSSRKEKSSADDSSTLDDVPAAVREQNHNRKLNTLKKQMAQLDSVKNKSKREALLHEANALLVDMADAPVKKNKKKQIVEDEEDEEAGLAELLDNTHAPSASPNPKPKKTKKAQNDELDRVLAGCTAQRFAGCPVPSNFSL